EFARHPVHGRAEPGGRFFGVAALAGGRARVVGCEDVAANVGWRPLSPVGERVRVRGERWAAAGEDQAGDREATHVSLTPTLSPSGERGSPVTAHIDRCPASHASISCTWSLPRSPAAA